MQIVVVAVVIGASGVAVLIGAGVLSSMWSSTVREMFERLRPGPSHQAVPPDLNGRNENNELHAVDDEASEAVHPLPAQNAEQRGPITLRRLLWGVERED